MPLIGRSSRAFSSRAIRPVSLPRGLVIGELPAHVPFECFNVSIVARDDCRLLRIGKALGARFVNQFHDDGSGLLGCLDRSGGAKPASGGRRGVQGVPGEV